MNRAEIVKAFNQIRDTRRQWREGVKEFEASTKPLLSRLLHEALVYYMSLNDIGEMAGLTPRQVRLLLKVNDLDPWSSKTLLSKKAAEALTTNAALMGVNPNEMDLMSPLAYLPMGSQMRADIAARGVSQVHEIPQDDLLERVATIIESETGRGFDCTGVAQRVLNVVQGARP